jgi:acyl carrier protein
VSDRGLLAEITQMLVDVTGENNEWAAAIDESTRLEGDLRLDSLEFAALGDRLRRHYGEAVDLPAHLVGLDMDRLVVLSVGDIVAFVAARPAV